MTHESGARPVYPAISLLSAILALRRIGVESAHRLEGVTEDELRTGAQQWVGSPTAARYYDAILELTSDDQRLALVREFVLLNPMIRTLAMFVPTLNEWLRLFWLVSGKYTVPFGLSYEVSKGGHVLSCSVPTTEMPGYGFLLLTHLSATQVPLVVGAPPLETRHLECTERELRAEYDVPALELGSPERIAQASELPLSAIFQSLELLGQGFNTALRDGLLAFPTELAPLLDEAAVLGSDWHLTPTEARVALALAEGRSPTEVGIELDITVATVRVHLKHLYAKTDTANQRELIDRVTAWRRGAA